jgi:hypothetical protein
MTANNFKKNVTLQYAIKTFQEARAIKDTERMYDMFKVLMELYRRRNRKITMLKTKIKQLKRLSKTEVR